VDEPRQPGGLTVDHAERLLDTQRVDIAAVRPARHQLRLHLKGGDRRPELVRRDRQELIPQAQRFLHFASSADQLGHFDGVRKQQLAPIVAERLADEIEEAGKLSVRTADAQLAGGNRLTGRKHLIEDGLAHLGELGENLSERLAERVGVSASQRLGNRIQELDRVLWPAQQRDGRW